MDLLSMFFLPALWKHLERRKLITRCVVSESFPKRRIQLLDREHNVGPPGEDSSREDDDMGKEMNPEDDSWPGPVCVMAWVAAMSSGV